MSGENNSDTSTSESEISACSSSFDPLKALYSKKTKIPVRSALMYESIKQYEDAQKYGNIAAVGQGDLVRKREEEKKRLKAEAERLLEEKNKQRFAQYQGKHFEVMFWRKKLIFIDTQCCCCEWHCSP